MITSPTLLLNRTVCRKNIRKMIDTAKRHDLTFKPHFKTHQSGLVGDWFREFGVSQITVSSVAMAWYFADLGWRHITVAFPVNVREIEPIDELAATVDLSLFVNDPGVAELLDKSLTATVKVYIEIDTGSGRTGLLPDQTAEIEELILCFSSLSNLTFKGFYSHPGHSYSARSSDEIMEVHRQVLAKMQDLKARSPSDDGYGPVCCIGDTPCCSVADLFEGVNEISPGNFVFYDLMQAAIGSCGMDEIAVALAAPVVALHPERKEAIIHGGAVHLSKEYLHWNGETIYGLPAGLNDDHTWSAPVEDSYLRSLSQEHGVLSCSDRFFRSLNIGDLVAVLPVHSCLAANLMEEYHLVG